MLLESGDLRYLFRDESGIIPKIRKLTVACSAFGRGAPYRGRAEQNFFEDLALLDAFRRILNRSDLRIFLWTKKIELDHQRGVRSNPPGYKKNGGEYEGSYPFFENLGRGSPLLATCLAVGIAFSNPHPQKGHACKKPD